jgi:hypothetical protein
MLMTKDMHKGRWYREPWVWLMILFPSMAVIGGMITIYLAVTTSDGLVVDDYYKRGKAINRVLERDKAAARYGLTASLAFDMRENRAQLELASNNDTRATELRLSVLHPTQPGKDQVIRLTPISESIYRGGLQPLADGHWYLQLEADDWRLSGSVRVPETGPVVLVPVQ